MMNLAMTCALLLGGLAIGWNAHTSSPEYRAEQEMKRAAAFLQAGEPVKAAGIYHQQISGPQATAAHAGLHDSIEACLKSGQPQTVATAFHLLASLPPAANQPQPILADAFQRGISLAGNFRSTNASGALDILAGTAELEPTNTVIKPLQIDLLKEVIAVNPDNTNRVVELALIYEADKQMDACAALLLPYQNKLGATEGARILGQHLLAAGKNDDAYGLLFPYVQTRLARLRAIEGGYTNATALAYQRAFDELNGGHAIGFSYDAYKAASKTDQDEMVGNFLHARMRTDPGFQRAQLAFKEANKIVPVTLDLGIVQLNRAQGLSDPSARKAELEAAEKTFLAIQGFAGETDEYRLFLGQVSYWLGKSKEGKELFDQLLVSKKRAYPILISLAGTLREVGETEQARQLCEEAYDTGKKGNEKFEAAALRARIEKDNDDEIAWLEKADPNLPVTQISLNDSRGQKALQNGNREQAAQYFRAAAAGYEKMQRSAPMLNNYGLACINLYGVTGDIADHDRGLAMIQEAVSLAPGNSVLLINTTHLLLTRAYMDAVGDTIRFNVIKDTPHRDMLQFLYANEAERLQVFERLRGDEYFKKSVTYLDKSLLLSPKRAQLYRMCLSMQNSVRDLPELQRLEQRLLTASPDLAETLRDTRDYYAGIKSDERLRLLQSEQARYEKLLKTPEITSHPGSLEFVRVELNSLQFQLAAQGVAEDGKKLAAEARATYDQHADAATLEGLITAGFFLAHQELAQQNPAYAELAKLTQRSLSPRMLIAALIERDDALAQAIRKNPTVLKTIELVKQRAQLFPTFRPVNDWALLARLDPAGAATVSRQLLADDPARLADKIEFQLNPLAGGSVLEQYWTSKMQGDEPHGLQMYQAALKEGVPLPPL